MNKIKVDQGFWGRMYQRLERRPIACLMALYAIFVALFFVTVPLPRVDGQLFGSDGTYYYAYLPSILMDHDLDFSNQHNGLLNAGNTQQSPAAHGTPAHNIYAVGSAVLWAPFFLIGHCIALVLHTAGLPVALDGMGYVYQIPTLFGSITYGFAGMLLVYRSCRRLFGRSASAAAAILICLATTLIYYMIAEPSMSHACSFFAAALFVDLWLKYRPLPNVPQWLLLGVAGGLVALVRLQDATLLALPFIDSLLALRSARKTALLRQVGGFLCFGIAAILLLIPQMVVLKILNGSAFKVGYPYSEGFFDWFSPHFFDVLFSLQHGLYTWHPLLLFATAGLILLYGRDRLFPFLLGLMFALQVYLIGSWFAWFGGDAFGGRMLVSSLPILALGLAALIDRAFKHKAWSIIGLLSCVLIVWNALLFAQYRFGYISRMDRITFKQMTLGKAIMAKDLMERAYRAVR